MARDITISVFLAIMVSIIVECETVGKAHEIKTCTQYQKEKLSHALSDTDLVGVTGMNIEKLRFTLHRAEYKNGIEVFGNVPDYREHELYSMLDTSKGKLSTIPCHLVWDPESSYLFYFFTNRGNS